MTVARLPVLFVLPFLAATLPAAAEDAGPNFDLKWSESGGLATAAPVARKPTRAPASPDIRLGANRLKVGAVDGAPGAEISPDNSNVSLGVGLAPGMRQDSLEMNGDVTGALQLKLDDGPITPSMTLRGPVTGAPEGGTAKDVRTMFGLGYKF